MILHLEWMLTDEVSTWRERNRGRRRRAPPRSTFRGLIDVGIFSDECVHFAAQDTLCSNGGVAATFGRA